MTKGREPGRQRHFRNKPRLGRRIDVRWRVLGPDGVAGEACASHTVNVSAGGAFIAAQAPAPAGARVELELAVPGGPPMTVGAEVRWIGPADDGTHGMGVRFQGLTPEQARALGQYFSSLTATLDHDDIG